MPYRKLMSERKTRTGAGRKRRGIGQVRPGRQVPSRIIETIEEVDDPHTEEQGGLTNREAPLRGGDGNGFAHADGIESEKPTPSQCDESGVET